MGGQGRASNRGLQPNLPKRASAPISSKSHPFVQHLLSPIINRDVQPISSLDPRKLPSSASSKALPTPQEQEAIIAAKLAYVEQRIELLQEIRELEAHLDEA